MKIHINGEKRVIALCDKHLLGKTLTDEKYHIDLKKHEEFYDGEPTNLAQIKEILNQDFSSINAIGSESVDCLMGEGLVSRENIKMVSNTPLVHIYKI